MLLVSVAINNLSRLTALPYNSRLPFRVTPQALGIIIGTTRRFVDSLQV